MRKMLAAFAASLAVLTATIPSGAAAAAPGADPAELRGAAESTRDDRHRAAALDGVDDPAGDADDRRGDILSVLVDNASDDGDIALSLKVAEGDRFSSPEWSEGFTGIVWDISTDSDTTAEYDATLVSDGDGVVVVFGPDDEAGCEGTPVAVPAEGLYGAVIPSSCIGSPAMVRVSAFMSYDWAYDCPTCPTSVDTTSWSPSVRRGTATTSPPTPTPSPSPSPRPSPSPAPNPDPTPSSGYYFVARDGGVFAFGAPFHGSAVGSTSSPVVGIAGNPRGAGYWIAEANGQVHARGVGHYGDMGGERLTAPIVGIAATSDGRGYWLLGADGGIFSFGTAAFHGSTGNVALNQPVIAMAAN